MKYFYLIIFIIIPSFVLSQSTPSIFNDGDITGSIGDKSVQLYGWGDGNITGTIGDEDVNLYDWGDGTITGTIGDEDVNL